METINTEKGKWEEVLAHHPVDQPMTSSKNHFFHLILQKIIVMSVRTSYSVCCTRERGWVQVFIFFPWSCGYGKWYLLLVQEQKKKNKIVNDILILATLEEYLIIKSSVLKSSSSLWYLDKHMLIPDEFVVEVRPWLVKPSVQPCLETNFNMF